MELKTEEYLKKNDPIETFERAVPGSSLTSEEGLYPYEGPQEYSDPEDVVEYYTEKLSNPEVVDNIMILLELGFPISTLAKTLLTTSQMAGIHSIDISLILSKKNVITNMLKTIGDEAGINYTTGEEPNKEDDSLRKREILSALIRKSLKEEERSGSDEGTEIMRDSLNMLDNPVETMNPGFQFKSPSMGEDNVVPDGGINPMIEPPKEIEYGKDFASNEPSTTQGLMSRGTI